MQAYRLHEADGHHAQVVKVFVESRSNCAGFLLADSTCLLVSLSPFNTCPPVSIPAPSTDACFVRLQACGGPILSSRAQKAASGGISASGGELGDEYAKLVEGRGPPGDVYSGPAIKINSADAYRGKGSRLVSNGTGKRITGNRTSRVFFLTAQPGKGGSCIDLRAWLCEPPSFTRGRVGLGSGKGPTNSGRSTSDNHRRRSRTGWGATARLDIPHGMSIKMVASVNVLVVYCISVGKIWVMAAKHVEGGDFPNKIDRTRKSTRGSIRGESETEFPEMFEGGLDSEIPGHLLLIKCAVVDVRRPVYSLHVSSQHLLLGELGGIWVWPLRPLIKPHKRQKDRERDKDLARILDGNVLHTPRFYGQNGHVSFGKETVSVAAKQVGNGQGDEGIGAKGAFSQDNNALPKDSEEDQQMVPTELKAQKTHPRAVIETQANEGGTVAGGDDGIHLKNDTVETYNLQGNGHLVHADIGKRSDVVWLSRSGMEGLHHDQKSQSFVSGSDRVSSMDAGSISEKSQSLDEKGLDHVEQPYDIRPLYVPISKADQQNVLMVGKEGDFRVEVVDIEEISLRTFLVLDSHGEMHLLTLDDMQEQGTSSPIQFRHPSITPFPNSMKVTLMAVLLPALSAPVSAGRRVWISDGHHSNHIVNMLGVGAYEGLTDSRNNNSKPRSVLSKTSQIVFSEEKVVALAAVSSEMMLVVTQGAIIVYVLSGN